MTQFAARAPYVRLATTAHGDGRPSRQIILLAVAAALATAPSARAATTQMVVEFGRKAGQESARLEYAAAPGEVNRLSVSDAAYDPAVDSTSVVLTDPAGIEPGRGFSRPQATDLTRVRCSASLWFVSFDVLLGDGDDSLIAPGGAGPIALDADGGRGSDRLESTLPRNTLAGGPGDDTLVGGEGDDTFREGAASDGTDMVSGGAGKDTVDYGERTRSVVARLAGGPGSGERSEADSLSSIEAAIGGSGADQLIGSARDDELTGGRGSDRLVGGRGDDTLRLDSGRSQLADGGPGADVLESGSGSATLAGGSGSDSVTGGAGQDRIRTRDGGADTVWGCGRSRDTAVLDTHDQLAGGSLISGPSGCERVRRSGPAVAVPLRASLGQSPTGLRPFIGCPADAPKRCRAHVSVTADGRSLGSRWVRIARGGDVSPRFSFDARSRALLEGGGRVRVRIAVRSRDASGRLRVRRVAYTASTGP